METLANSLQKNLTGDPRKDPAIVTVQKLDGMRRSPAPPRNTEQPTPAISIVSTPTTTSTTNNENPAPKKTGLLQNIRDNASLCLLIGLAGVLMGIVLAKILKL